MMERVLGYGTRKVHKCTFAHKGPASPIVARQKPTVLSANLSAQRVSGETILKAKDPDVCRSRDSKTKLDTDKHCHLKVENNSGIRTDNVSSQIW